MQKDSPPVESSPLADNEEGKKSSQISNDMEFDEENSPNKEGKEYASEGDYARQVSVESFESGKNLLNSSADSSNKSVKIIEFDEDGNISPPVGKK